MYPDPFLPKIIFMYGGLLQPIPHGVDMGVPSATTRHPGYTQRDSNYITQNGQTYFHQ